MKEINKLIITLYVLLLTFVISFNAFSQEQGTIHIETEKKGAAEVFIKQKGTTKFVKAAKEIPANINVIIGKNYDIKIAQYENIIFRYMGEKQGIEAGQNISISLGKEIAWDRVLLILILIGGLSGTAIYINRAGKAKILENNLKEAQLIANQAETKAREAEILLERTSTGTLIPEKIGSYKVITKIGEGGMASVYKVVDSFGDCFALKVPHARILENQEFFKRFSHEAAIGKGLRHQNIVGIHDFNLEPETGIPYICFEFIEGNDLSSILKREKKLEISMTLKYARQITKALVYAHEKRIIHRDLKPQNIMIDTRNNVKIMDFGIAKASEMSALTHTDMMLGTPLYMAPEQIDSKAVDHRADLYAVGIIMYQCLTGRIPFDEEDTYSIVVKKIHEDIPSPSIINPKIPENMVKLIMRLLAREPAGRYLNASELLSELNKETGA